MIFQFPTLLDKWIQPKRLKFVRKRANEEGKCSLHTSFPQPIPDASVLPADSAPASSGSSLPEPPESSPNNDVTVPPPLRRSDRVREIPIHLPGRRFVLTWPEFEVVHSWYKAYVFVHILALNGGAFVASLAKEGDKVNQDGKEMLTNVVVFLIFLSTGMSVANALHELNEKLKTWNWFKFLVLLVLMPINCVIIKTAYTEKGDGVSKDKKGDYGDHLLILFLISGMLSDPA
ncbi:hypothetical protein RHGRI_021309 [Rhododendron griersonianum]|uniref:Uncharacterized protein n=1 Tax=Rhododendron griersonianum TaxID=479676 RepID=A0AAV6JJS6_9ERIC|nr:hypothetical protein RHGRI_021309 [Rhododendron griersonianum]